MLNAAAQVVPVVSESCEHPPAPHEHRGSLIRLDAPGDQFNPCDLPLDAVDVADAIRDAAGLVRLVVDLPHGESMAQKSSLMVGVDQALHRQTEAENAPQHPMTTTGSDPGRGPDNQEPAAHQVESHPDMRIPHTMPPSRSQQISDRHLPSINTPDRLVLRFGTQTDRAHVAWSTCRPDRVARGWSNRRPSAFQVCASPMAVVSVRGRSLWSVRLVR